MSPITEQSVVFNISQQRDAAARSCKDSGGKVVGYLSNTIPLEILHAANMMPLHLYGLPDETTARADEYMEPAFDPATRAVFEQLLRGNFSWLDLIVLPRSNDALQRMYYYLCELKRKHADVDLPPVYLVDLLHTPWQSSADYNLQRLRCFLADIGKLSGTMPQDTDLQNSIEQYNTARRLLAQFTHLRATREIPSLLAHQVYAAAQSLSVTQFIQAMKTLLEEQAGTATYNPSRKRLVLAGNGLDHAAVHETIDALDASVVGDFHAYGNQYLVSQIGNDSDPLAAISVHYHRETRSCRSFRPDPQEVIRFAHQQNADGILFFYLRNEEALTWLYPAQERAARAAGLPCIALHDQPYQTDRATLHSQLNEFIGSL